MSPTHDLKHALELVAGAERPLPDPAADLGRAQAAGRDRTRRRIRVGLAGLAVVAVAGVGAGSLLTGSPSGRDEPAVSAHAAVRLVAKSFDAAPYTFDLTPAGWSVQAQQPTAVTIAPDDGSTSSEPDDFRGKLVIMFDANEPDGRVVDLDGRTFWISGDSGYTTIATRTRGDEPTGVVRIQYPNNAGWDEDSMLAFLASVHVGPNAQQGVG